MSLSSAPPPPPPPTPTVPAVLTADDASALYDAVADGDVAALRCAVARHGVGCLERAAGAVAGTAGGTTLLIDAVVYARVDVVRFLLASGGVDARRANCYDYTPLHYAAEQGSDELVSLLLAHGAAPDADGGERGDGSARNATPLHWAAMEGHTRVARRLLVHGASTTRAHGDARETCVDAATRGRHTSLAALLDAWPAVRCAVVARALPVARALLAWTCDDDDEQRRASTTTTTMTTLPRPLVCAIVARSLVASLLERAPWLEQLVDVHSAAAQLLDNTDAAAVATAVATAERQHGGARASSTTSSTSSLSLPPLLAGVGRVAVAACRLALVRPVPRVDRHEHLARMLAILDDRR